MALFVRIVVALVPLALTPALVWLLAEGYLNLGGGEKDILMALPWMLWSLIFAIVTMVFGSKGRTLGRSLGTASLWASGILVGVWFLLLLVTSGWLGIR